MQSINATDLDRKSGGAQWRDLQFFHSNRYCPSQPRHDTLLNSPPPLSSRPEHWVVPLIPPKRNIAAAYYLMH